MYWSRRSGSRARAAWNTSSIFAQSSGFISVLFTDLTTQPGLRQSPIAHHRARRNFHHLSRLLDAQSAEEPHFDYLTLSAIKLGQGGERIVERHHFRGPRLGYQHRFIERDLLRPASALSIMAAAGVINQNASHHLRGYPEEVRAVLPPYAPLIDQSDKGLVDQRGC